MCSKKFANFQQSRNNRHILIDGKSVFYQSLFDKGIITLENLVTDTNVLPIKQNPNGLPLRRQVQNAGHRSQVTGHRLQGTGHGAQVTENAVKTVKTLH